jgi:hypothetical protein
MEKIFALASISNWHLLPQTELVIDHHKHTLILEEAIQCLLQESHLVANKHSSFLEVPVSESSSNHGQVMLHVSKKDLLCAALLDYIINLTTLVPDSSSFTEPRAPPLLGSLGAEAFISSMNLSASIKKEQARTKNDWKAYQGHICEDRAKFKNILKHKVKDGDFKNILRTNIKDGNFKNILRTNIKDGGVPQRLIIPIVWGPPDSPGHFFVACFDFLVDDDSLERSRKRIRQSSIAAKLPRKSISSSGSMFFMKPNTSAYQSDADLFQRAEHEDRTMDTTAESLLLLWCYIFWSKE